MSIGMRFTIAFLGLLGLLAFNWESSPLMAQGPYHGVGSGVTWVDGAGRPLHHSGGIEVDTGLYGPRGDRGSAMHHGRGRGTSRWPGPVILPPGFLYYSDQAPVTQMPAPPSLYAFNGFVYGTPRGPHCSGAVSGVIYGFWELAEPRPVWPGLPPLPSWMHAGDAALEEANPSTMPLEELPPPESDRELEFPSLEGPHRDGSRVGGERSVTSLEWARDAFRDGRYAAAHRALTQIPSDQPLSGTDWLFRSQAALAVGDFADAVGALENGLLLSDPQQQGEVVANFDRYYGRDDYVAQIDALNAAIVAEPSRSELWALRGYHYFFLGHEEAGQQDLIRADITAPRRTPLIEQLARVLKVDFDSRLVARPRPEN